MGKGPGCGGFWGREEIGLGKGTLKDQVRKIKKKGVEKIGLSRDVGGMFKVVVEVEVELVKDEIG